LSVNDTIKTIDGIEKIAKIENCGYKENMYDISMGDNTSRTFYSNGILHHNTVWCGNIAIEMVKSGLNGAYISLEMPEYAMLQRFGPKLFGIKIDDFASVSQDPLKMQKLIYDFKNSTTRMGDSLFSSIKPGELFLKEFPTSTATTIDIHNYIKKLQETNKLKLDFIVVDYINIMANWRNPNSDNTYYKIKQVAEDLRAVSQIEDIAIITATQTKNHAVESSDFSSVDVAESSGLNHTLDSEWGIIMTPEMYANREYILKNLLNRHGGMKFSKKKFIVDYDYMSITETNEPIYDEFGGTY
jgi:hypothetical protein